VQKIPNNNQVIHAAGHLAARHPSGIITPRSPFRNKLYSHGRDRNQNAEQASEGVEPFASTGMLMLMLVLMLM